MKQHFTGVTLKEPVVPPKWKAFQRTVIFHDYLNRRGPIFQLCFFHQQMQKLQLNPELQALDVDYVKTSFLWPATSSPGGIR
jgi:hypothetical protein